MGLRPQTPAQLPAGSRRPDTPPSLRFGRVNCPSASPPGEAKSGAFAFKLARHGVVVLCSLR